MPLHFAVAVRAQNEECSVLQFWTLSVATASKQCEILHGNPRVRASSRSGAGNSSSAPVLESNVGSDIAATFHFENPTREMRTDTQQL
jgi:hypothetical protein